MTPERFHQILVQRTSQMQGTLSTKAKEYALNNDRLYNFKAAAQIKGETPAQALWGIAIKHLVCVIDMIENRLEPTQKNIDDHLGDMLNYLVLLEAVFKEDDKDNLPSEWGRKVAMGRYLSGRKQPQEQEQIVDLEIEIDDNDSCQPQTD
jgi:hypothetical protein